MKVYRREGKVAERPHLNLPEGTYEEELGLDGFYGPVSHLYFRHAPTSWKEIKLSPFQWPAEQEVDTPFLKPQCFQSAPAQLKGDFFTSSRLLFWNQDIRVHVHRVTESLTTYFRNADASEAIFCHEGSFVCDSVFGKLQVEKGDYLVIPKGVTWRMQEVKSVYILRIENLGRYFKKPDTGILGQQALYHEEGIRTPVFTPELASSEQSLVRVQSNNRLTDIQYGHDLRTLSGWMGTLYPYVLPVSKIAPILSTLAHLPPSVNSTFLSDQFIVCTFLPRPLEEPDGALKVPFFHSNIDYDEVIFYHAGDFFSRDNMGAGYVTLHPRGINHGPHPKALLNQNKKKRTDEIAVMIDTFHPLKVSRFAREVELADYWKSWMG